MKTVYDVIEKLEKDRKREAAVLRAWMTEFERHEPDNNNDDAYCQISGFMWGLCVFGYITYTERDDIMNWVIYDA